MSDKQRTLSAKPTGTRRSYEVCGLGYLDLADRLVNQDRSLADAVLTIGRRLDECDGDLLRRLDAMRYGLDGTRPQTAVESRGSAMPMGASAQDFLAASEERDDLLEQFEVVLAKAHQVLRITKQHSPRPVIRFA
jgi:hypothetical protein